MGKFAIVFNKGGDIRNFVFWLGIYTIDEFYRGIYAIDPFL